MSHLCLWAIDGNLPVNILAVIGAFALGGFLGGWAISLTAKFAFNQRVPNWLAWTMRLLIGLVAGWVAWLCLFGTGGGGLGGSGWGMGGGGNGNSKDRAAEKDDKSAKDTKPPEPEETPKPKDPDSKPKKDGPGIGSGETIRVEVLGDVTLEQLAGGGKANLDKRYRIADAPRTLHTFGEIKDLIRERRSQTPPLSKLVVIIAKLDVHAAEPRRDGMHAIRRAGGRTHSQAAVEHRVVLLPAEVQPAEFGEAFFVGLDARVVAPVVFDGPGLEGELGAPDVIVRERVQVRLHHRRDDRRPGPRMLFEIEQRALLVGLFRHCP